MKHCPPEFKADAIALYQSRPGATIRWVAADLGVNPETLRNWARAAGANRLRGRWTEVPPRRRWRSSTPAGLTDYGRGRAVHVGGTGLFRREISSSGSVLRCFAGVGD
jgi:hypothetical protein